MIENTRVDDPNVLVVDAGNFAAKSSTVKEQEKAQQRRKAELQMEAFALSKIDAVAIGEKDLSLGVDWFFTNAQRFDLPLLASNLQCSEYVVQPRIEKRVGAVSVVFHSAINPKQLIDGCTSRSPIEALKGEVGKNGTIDVLLSQLPTHQLDDLLGEVDIDLVIDSRHGRQIQSPEVLRDQTLLLSSGRKGQYVGYAEIMFDADRDGLTSEGSVNSVKSDIAKWERRLRSNQQKDVLDEKAERKRESQRVFYEEKLKESQEKLSLLEASAEKNVLRNELIQLGLEVEKWTGLTEAILRAKTDIEALPSAEK